ncbi:MAG TPA: helix-turn-helix domain-containing protein [Caldisericia bacterium]|nr:helix-turn-helix domain-containing protein [Caldisericia bacterium]
MKNINKSKAITPVAVNKIKRMSKIATQTMVAIQTSKTITEASLKLGITRSALYERIKRYDLMSMIDDIRKEAETDLVVSTPAVAQDLIDVALGNKKANSVELQAKQDVLDRAGITKKDNSGNINIASKDMVITFEQV